MSGMQPTTNLWCYNVKSLNTQLSGSINDSMLSSPHRKYNSTIKTIKEVKIIPNHFFPNSAVEGMQNINTSKNF